LSQMGEQVFRRFVGRPRFAMKLVAGMLMGETPDAVAKSVLNDRGLGLKAKLQALKGKPLDSTPGSSVSSDSVYSDLRNAASKWILKGEASRLRCGEVALEAGVCALAVRAGDVFVVTEPLVLEAFTDLPTAEFENLAKQAHATIGDKFEEYLAWKADVLCELLSSDKLGVPVNTDFKGPWVPIMPGGDLRRGTQAKDGQEPELLRAMLDRPSNVGTSLVFPGTAMGSDIVIVARRTGASPRWLLLFVQVKACLKISTPQAMRSLKYPYHVNRDQTSRHVAEGMEGAAQALNEIMARDDVSVVLLVVKFPAQSVAGYQRVQETTQELKIGQTTPTKKVLEIVVDGSSVR